MKLQVFAKFDIMNLIPINISKGHCALTVNGAMVFWILFLKLNY